MTAQWAVRAGPAFSAEKGESLLLRHKKCSPPKVGCYFCEQKQRRRDSNGPVVNDSPVGCQRRPGPAGPLLGENCPLDSFPCPRNPRFPAEKGESLLLRHLRTLILIQCQRPFICPKMPVNKGFPAIRPLLVEVPGAGFFYPSPVATRVFLHDYPTNRVNAPHSQLSGSLSFSSCVTRASFCSPPLDSSRR